MATAITTSPTKPETRIARLARQRSVQLTAVGWILATLLVVPLSGGSLPFDRPLVAGLSVGAQIFSQQVQLLLALVLMGATYLVTRHRVVADLAARAPDRSVAVRETASVLVYGAAVLGVGQVIGRLVGTHGIGLHLPGSIYGLTDSVTPVEVVAWAVYNFTFYAALPYLVFRVRGYSTRALSLHSTDLRNDLFLIGVILVMECASELGFSPAIFALSGHQVLVGGSLTALFTFFGTSLPIMVFIFCILLPRYLKLTGS